ncbi:MAG: hypothetical protein PHE67_07915 [Campylobacterales bacterium]|nr:hypothetical protein [Campylobacterales bacterium]
MGLSDRDYWRDNYDKNTSSRGSAKPEWNGRRSLTSKEKSTEEKSGFFSIIVIVAFLLGIYFLSDF